MKNFQLANRVRETLAGRVADVEVERDLDRMAESLWDAAIETVAGYMTGCGEGCMEAELDCEECENAESFALWARKTLKVQQ